MNSHKMDLGVVGHGLMAGDMGPRLAYCNIFYAHQILVDIHFLKCSAL